MKKRPGFYVSTAACILTVLLARFLWMPYTGTLTMELPFYFVRWAFYAVAIGAGNFFFYMVLTNFWTRFVPGFLIPLGARIALDGMIYLSVKYLGAWSYTVRYVLDAAFIVLAGFCITYPDRKSKKWTPRMPGVAGWIALSLAAAVLLAMVLRVQADAAHIAAKYVMESERYQESLQYIAMDAYWVSLAVSFAGQYAMVLYLINDTQASRIRARGFAAQFALSLGMLVAIGLRCAVFLAYFYGLWNFPSGSFLIENDLHPKRGFYIVYQELTYNWLNRAHERVESGGTISYQVLDVNEEYGVRYTPKEERYSHSLEVDGYQIFYRNPYALFYYDGSTQRIMLAEEVKDQPQEALLTDALKAGILDNDFEVFAYGAPYLQKYDPTFIEPYVERYARGDFTEQELADMGSIRPDYVQGVARRLASAR